MKNPRSIDIDQALLDKHKLSDREPPRDSLFQEMWNASRDIAQTALGSDFIQGIKAGTLDPVQYGAFNVNDAYYCFHGADDYLAARKRAQDPALKAFLQKKYLSYQKYNEEFSKTWRIKDGTAILPSGVCKQYSEFESTVARNEDPLYCVVVMIPCEYLWAWLAAELSPPSKNNLYAPWIAGNNSPMGAYVMGNFLEAYMKTFPGRIQKDRALSLYKQAMTFEAQNFGA